MTVTPKGIPTIPNDTGVQPDPQAALQAIATESDKRIDQFKFNYTSGAETFSQAAYGQATSPDRVQNIVVPTKAMLVVGFTALWKASAAGTFSAAIFIGSNQLKVPVANAVPAVQEAVASPGAATGYCFLMSSRRGIDGLMVAGSDATVVNTGMLLWSPGGTLDGGLCYIWVAAGTYDISVRYKNSAGTLTIKERRLWVRSVNYL